MQLILMRHAKSDWHTDTVSDFDRPLNKRGNRDAPRMGRWLARHNLVPNKIVSSPALRARQTILAVVAELGVDAKKITWDESIYEADVHDLLEVLRKEAAGQHCLMLVGHCPAIDALATYLSGTISRDIKGGKLMTTSALAVFEFHGEIQKHGADSAMLVRARDVDD